MLCMRYLVPVALLWQVANVVPIEGTSSASPSTSVTDLIMTECISEVSQCSTGGSDCLECLTKFTNGNVTFDDTTTSDCTSTYIVMCDVLVELECNLEDANVNDLAGCISSTIFSGCEDFESCNASAFPFALSPAPSPGLSSAPSPPPSPASSPAASSTLTPSTMAPSSNESKTETPSSGIDEQEDDGTSSGTPGRLQSGACSMVILMFSLAYVASAAFES